MDHTIAALAQDRNKECQALFKSQILGTKNVRVYRWFWRMPWAWQIWSVASRSHSTHIAACTATFGGIVQTFAICSLCPLTIILHGVVAHFDCRQATKPFIAIAVFRWLTGNGVCSDQRGLQKTKLRLAEAGKLDLNDRPGPVCVKSSTGSQQRKAWLQQKAWTSTSPSLERSSFNLRLVLFGRSRISFAILGRNRLASRCTLVLQEFH